MYQDAKQHYKSLRNSGESNRVIDYRSYLYCEKVGEAKYKKEERFAYGVHGPIKYT